MSLDLEVMVEGEGEACGETQFSQPAHLVSSTWRTWPGKAMCHRGAGYGVVLPWLLPSRGKGVFDDGMTGK